MIVNFLVVRCSTIFIFFIGALLFGLVGYAQESSSILCSDGIDNDGDGLVDCLDGDCTSLPNQGCLMCGSGNSFADSLLEYLPGCVLEDQNPKKALGVSDWPSSTFGDSSAVVSLGREGSLRLGFVNNILTNSGNGERDLLVFEVDSNYHSCRIELRPSNSSTENKLLRRSVLDVDGDGYYNFGDISRAVQSIDIDVIVPGYAAGELWFDAIEITDLSDSCQGESPGVDIDAVCALTSISIDCAGIPNGLLKVDQCGECLEPTDPRFNHLCNGESYLYIPNAFSPNGDLVNDNFRVYAKERIVSSIASLSIYDRWGGQVYIESNLDINSNNGWWTGESLPQGTYAYIVELELFNGTIETVVGDVLLLR